MTYEQAIRIASRTLAAYLLLWAVSDATHLPGEILSLVHEYQGPNGLGFSILNAPYYVRMSILYLAENILHIALWLMAAGWFYRCGPRIQRFFTSTGIPSAD